MPYCTQSDIEKQIPEDVLIELTDDDGIGSVVADVIDSAIADADEEIDAWVAMQYSLPFAVTPRLILRMSVDLTICNLYARRPHLNIPESREKRCDDDRKLLKQIAAGKPRLDVQETPKISGSSMVNTRAKEYGTDTLGKY